MNKLVIEPEGYYAFNDIEPTTDSLLNLNNPFSSREEARARYSNAMRILKGSTILNAYKQNFPELNSKFANIAKGALTGAAIGGTIGGLGGYTYGVDDYHDRMTKEAKADALNEIALNETWDAEGLKELGENQIARDKLSRADWINEKSRRAYDEAYKGGMINAPAESALKGAGIGAGLGALIGGIKGAMK